MKSEHPVTRYLQRFGQGSRRAVEHGLRVIAATLGAPDSDPLRADWSGLDAAACARVREQVVNRFSAATARRVLLVLRGVLKLLAEDGAMDAAVYRSVTSLGARKRAPAGEAVRRSDLVRLFESCRDDATAAGCRDAAALALLYGAGMRRADAVALDLGDYHRGRLEAQAGNRGQPQRIRLPKSAREALSAWLALRGDAPGPLLCPVDKAGRIQLRRMTDQALYLIVGRRSRRAGVPLSPNALRRPFAARRAGLVRAQRRRQGPSSPLPVGGDVAATTGLPVPFRGCGPRSGAGDAPSCGREPEGSRGVL